MQTPVNGPVDQQGELRLTSPAFEDGELLPEYVGFANENENPPLHIEGVPEGAETLVLIMDDPDAADVVGHVWDHWLVFNISASVEEIPRGWYPGDDDAVVAYNDFLERDWGGPAPPGEPHAYHFKLFALDATLDYPPAIRKTRLGSAMTMDANILSQTQLTGEYGPEQGIPE